MATATAARKVMILGGRLMLKEFLVRAYKRSLVTTKHKTYFNPPGSLIVKEINVERTVNVWTPMTRVVTIKAVSGFEAAKQYARMNQLKDAMWLEVKDPQVVIRVSLTGQKAP